MTTVLCGTSETDFAAIRLGLAIDAASKGGASVAGEPLATEVRELRLPRSPKDARSLFSHVSALMHEWLNKGDVSIVVAVVEPMNLSPLLPAGPENLLAMLILAFPEVRWLFGTIKGYETFNERIGESDEDSKVRKKEVEAHNESLRKFRIAQNVDGLFLSTSGALFDGVGLRDWVRRCAIGNEGNKTDATYLARRVQSALALDEETPYARLHAYAAYRFGYRAVAPASFALADYFLGRETSGAAKCPAIEKWHLVFEDVYVNFADGKPGLSKLYRDPSPQAGHFRGRADEWNRLEDAEHRIFITSGHHDDPTKWALNEAYIAGQKASTVPNGRPRNIALLNKPYAGIFRLWEGSGLMQKLCWPNPGTGKKHRGVADEFVWPPTKESFSSNEQGHSSPGVLLIIAEQLIARAEKLLPNVHSVEEAVYGAVLANDALELLGCRTPTVAVEALRLKHRFEVLAECQFSGVEHHIRLTERLEEIQRDVQAISQWFGRDQRATAATNAEMQILLGLVRVFRDYGQFDEENTCMQQVRTLNRRIWFLKGKPWVVPLYPLRWYVEFLLGSAPRFVGAIAGWILVLTILFAATGIPLKTALEATFSSFIGIQPPAGPNPSLSITIVAMLAGATHLGIFISHLYTLVSRK